MPEKKKYAEIFKKLEKGKCMCIFKETCDASFTFRWEKTQDALG
jgi:hypothetical protein